MLAPDTILQNRYQIARLLSQGGMGAVYLARDKRLQCDVALKETFFTDEALLKQFEREALLLANLRHPALPRVIDHFTEDNGQFLVMDFISGKDLLEMLEQRGRPFPPGEVLGWADQLLSALEHLHKRNPPIIHRDIKPQNLKLNDEGQIILLDFGLAKGAAWQMSRATTGKSVFGYTPSYAPLEQIRGMGTDPRSDLYSLGATLYHLITGEIPVDALDRVTKVADGQPDPLRLASELNAEVRPQAAAILMQAMALNRENRYTDAAEMRRALSDASRPVPTPKKGEESTVIAPPSVDGFSYQETVRKQQTATLPIDGHSPAPPQPDKKTEEQNVKSVVAPPQPKPLASQEQIPKKQITLINPPSSKSRNWRLFGGIAVLAVALITVVVIFLVDLGPSAIPPASSQPDLSGVAKQENVEPQTYTETVNNVGIDMVRVPAGKFLMGSPANEEGRDKNDEGQGPHEVSVSSFYMGKYEVTQAQWRAVSALPKVKDDLPSDPSNFKGDNLPVEQVSWDEAVEFCERLSKATGKKYRLPTEAEWEYACRSLTKGPYAGNLDSMGWYDKNSGNKTHPVGTKQPNGFRLYDMHGNVWEWCSDWYSENYYSQSPSTDPTGPSSGSYRVGRGGGWGGDAQYLRSADRFRFTPVFRFNYLGFRLVRTYN